LVFDQVLAEVKVRQCRAMPEVNVRYVRSLFEAGSDGNSKAAPPPVDQPMQLGRFAL
jgi:hypothetical protein